MPLTSTNVGDLTAYRRSFERSLRAANKSQRTVETYLDALDQLCAFLADRGMPTAAESVTREHIESYLVELLDLGRAPATVSNRFRALQQFFKFLVGEGEIASSPMERMTRPRVPDQPVQVLSEDELRTPVRGSENAPGRPAYTDAYVLRARARSGASWAAQRGSSDPRAAGCSTPLP